MVHLEILYALNFMSKYHDHAHYFSSFLLNVLDYKAKACVRYVNYSYELAITFWHSSTKTNLCCNRQRCLHPRVCLDLSRHFSLKHIKCNSLDNEVRSSFFNCNSYCRFLCYTSNYFVLNFSWFLCLFVSRGCAFNRWMLLRETNTWKNILFLKLKISV